MKIKIQFLPFVLVGLITTLARSGSGQIFTVLHSLKPDSDGAAPFSGLIVSGNILYGMTRYGGSSGGGTIFKLNTDGSGFTNLYNFTATDGENPTAGLLLSGNVLYGTANSGGDWGYGTVFAINTDGTSFQTLHSFTDAVYQVSSLILSSNTLYGMTDLGGTWGNGTVFALNIDGGVFTNLHIFSTEYNFTNFDGAFPLNALTLAGSTLYATTAGGGDYGQGTVFALNTDGSNFRVIHSFSHTNGGDPNAGLVLSGDRLYGATAQGGLVYGSVFAVNTDGTDFTNLYNFTPRSGPNSTNSDGSFPGSTPVLSENILYGTADVGGSFDSGTVFKVKTDGTGFAVMHTFTGTSGGTNSDGAMPAAGLAMAGNTLYGTTSSGGIFGAGTIFSIFVQPELAITSAGPDVILTWPTNAIGFTLQSTTNLGTSASWTHVTPDPVVVNGQNTVTNPSSGTEQFFRLSQ